MSKNLFYAAGQWNFICDFCGRRAKSSDGEKTWNGFYVCKSHKEKRNPQDLLKGVKEVQTLPWTRPETEDKFVPMQCNIIESSAIPAQAIPGCMTPSNNYVGV